MKKIVGLLAFVFTVKFFVGYRCVYAQQVLVYYQAKYAKICDIRNGYDEEKCKVLPTSNVFIVHANKIYEQNPVTEDIFTYTVIGKAADDEALYIETIGDDGNYYIYIFYRERDDIITVIPGNSKREYSYNTPIFIVTE